MKGYFSSRILWRWSEVREKSDASDAAKNPDRKKRTARRMRVDVI